MVLAHSCAVANSPIADSTCQAKVFQILRTNTALDHGIVREVERDEMVSHLVHSLCNKKIHITIIYQAYQTCASDANQ